MLDRERRRHKRLKAKGVAARFSSGATKALLTVSNITPGGVFLRSSLLFAVGTEVTLEISAPGVRSSLKVAGRVANVVTDKEAAESGQAQGMGIQFVEGTPGIVQRLQDLIGSSTASLTPSEVDGARPRRGASQPPQILGREAYGGDPEVARADSRDRKPASGPYQSPPQLTSTPISSPPAWMRSQSLTPRPSPAPAPSSAPADLQVLLRLAQEEVAQLRRENELLREKLKRFGG